MRALLWVIGLFALAVALPVAARYFPGYVLLVLPAHRVKFPDHDPVVLCVTDGEPTAHLMRDGTPYFCWPQRSFSHTSCCGRSD